MTRARVAVALAALLVAASSIASSSIVGQRPAGAEVPPPSRRVYMITDSVGLGSENAMAAAFVWARAKGKEFWDALRWAVATGTASAQLPGVTFANLDQTKAIYKKVEVRPVR